MIWHIFGYGTMASQFILGAAFLRYVWTIRTPIDASIRRLRIPEIDPDATWQLSNSSDVGVI